MKDTIHREDAIESMTKAIWYYPNELYPCLNSYEHAHDLAEQGLRFLQSAEPEIIRCRDCKYAHLTYDGECKHCDKWTDEFGIPEELYLDDDFYCGYAKMRTE